jgi:SAM-dependent methyltransferase
MTGSEIIEILPVSLLDEHRPLVNELRRLAKSLELDFGWHYLLDLTWIIARLGDVSGKLILDAGAGTGVLQWYLAECGAHVWSVDRMDRADIPWRLRRRYHLSGLRKEDLHPALQALFRPMHQANPSLRGRLNTGVRNLTSLAHLHRAPGRVIFYHQDLSNLVDVPDISVDAIVSVSALEHNLPEQLPSVVAELMRTLKPGGQLLASLCAARSQDWYHKPSSGWCYTRASLQEMFSLPAGTPSNYDHYDELFAALRECSELRDNLAKFYSKSADNGMPWGVWDPQYQPVGVCKLRKLG